MNNRYICRGKRKDNDEWIEGNLLALGCDAYRIATSCLQGDNGNLLNLCVYRVIPETVGQCTGLKDKNGKLIFEGDVLKQKTTKEFAKFNSFKWELYGIVTFGNYDYNEGDAGYCSVGWYIAPLKSIAIYPKDYLIGDIQPGLNQEDILKSIYPMEVIGNIHDNPELLEAER
jgi:uncharacterized phage protein (TIGR01671 family)